MVAKAYCHPTIDRIRPTHPKLAARLERYLGYLDPETVAVLAIVAPDEPIAAGDTTGRLYVGTPRGVLKLAAELVERGAERIEGARLYPFPDYL